MRVILKRQFLLLRMRWKIANLEMMRGKCWIPYSQTVFLQLNFSQGYTGRFLSLCKEKSWKRFNICSIGANLLEPANAKYAVRHYYGLMIATPKRPQLQFYSCWITAEQNNTYVMPLFMLRQETFSMPSVHLQK